MRLVNKSKFGTYAARPIPVMRNPQVKWCVSIDEPRLSMADASQHSSNRSYGWTSFAPFSLRFRRDEGYDSSHQLGSKHAYKTLARRSSGWCSSFDVR